MRYIQLVKRSPSRSAPSPHAQQHVLQHVVDVARRHALRDVRREPRRHISPSHRRCHRQPPGSQQVSASRAAARRDRRRCNEAVGARHPRVDELDAVRRDRHLDRREAGVGQHAAVVVDRRGARDAAEVGPSVCHAAGDRRDRDDVGDRQSAAIAQHAERLAKHRGPLGRQVDHAVRQDHVHRTIRDREVLDLAEAELDVAASNLRALLRAGGPSPASCRRRSRDRSARQRAPPANHRSRHRRRGRSPGRNAAITRGLPQPELEVGPSGTAARSSAVYPTRAELAGAAQHPALSAACASFA
jgi:hypothetical protein